jgi:hypothetical protein
MQNVLDTRVLTQARELMRAISQAGATPEDLKRLSNWRTIAAALPVVRRTGSVVVAQPSIGGLLANFDIEEIYAAGWRVHPKSVDQLNQTDAQQGGWFLGSKAGCAGALANGWDALTKQLPGLVGVSSVKAVALFLKSSRWQRYTLCLDGTIFVNDQAHAATIHLQCEEQEWWYRLTLLNEARAPWCRSLFCCRSLPS